MICSMTGYGSAEHRDESCQVSVEIKTYNNRFLELNLTLPSILNPLEDRLRARVRQTLQRGRVDVFVRFRDLGEVVEVSLDDRGILAWAKALRETARLAGISQEPALEHFVAAENLIRLERNRNSDGWWVCLEAALASALDQVSQSRLREGQAILADLLAQLDRMEGALDCFKANAAGLEATIRENLLGRFAEVLGNTIDQDRVLAEVAVQLNRSTVNEEIVRLAAHLGAARDMLSTGGPVGKKLDFLCQELNREINTIGSKSIQLDMGQAVIEAKDALENLREQLRNVE